MTSLEPGECPDADVLLDAASGRAVMTASLEAHLATCDACRIALAALLQAGRGALDGGSGAAAPFGAFSEGDRVHERFRLVRVIGFGGAGTVWEAVDERSGGLVALKVLRRFGSSAVRRQRREARIAMALVHPAIAPVLELIEEDATRGPILVMRRYLGESLETLLANRGPLEARETARLLVPVLDALSFAHARGVVHRDVKPANVFVAEDGVRVLDFGLAKLLDEAATLGSRITRTGEVLGTPRFMAPEQVFGELVIDARVDVWSAAAVAYLTLCGETPVAATSLGETVRAHARGEVVPLAERRPELPRYLTDAVMHALVRDRDARSSSVTELRAALVRAGAAAPGP